MVENGQGFCGWIPFGTTVVPSYSSIYHIKSKFNGVAGVPKLSIVDLLSNQYVPNGGEGPGVGGSQTKYAFGFAYTFFVVMMYIVTMFY